MNYSINNITEATFIDKKTNEKLLEINNTDTVDFITECLIDAELNINLLTLREGVEEYYKKNVNGNQDLSTIDIRKKLTRNVLLAKKVKPREDKPCLRLYLYGQLQILVKDGKEVVWLKNNKGGHTYKMNKIKKQKINELLLYL